jgi:integrase
LPNSLTPEQVGPFLAALRENIPQHYAMAFLGFATGLRSSSLRPLRRKGDEVDVLLNVGKLRVRQSQTLVLEVVEKYLLDVDGTVRC